MNPTELSTCFCTNDVKACRAFYQKYLGAEITFDCGWYLNLRIGTSVYIYSEREPSEEYRQYFK